MKKSLICLTIILFLIITYRLIDIRIINNQKYYENYEIKANNNITGLTAPRGRILDTNGKVLVDNVTINNIIYRSLNNTDDEMNIAIKLRSILGLNDEASDNELKNYYIATNETDYLLTSDELNQYKYRILTDNDIYKLKINRIKDEINKLWAE